MATSKQEVKIETPNIQIGAKVVFLETPVYGVLEHTKLASNKIRDRLVIKQINSGEQKTNITVAKIADSIADSINQITKTQSTDDQTVKINWPEGVENILNSIEVDISQIYLKVEIETKILTQLEYALGIAIKLNKDQKDKLSKIPPFNLILLEELFLKIWNTNNKKILDEMNIFNIDDFLQENSETKLIESDSKSDKKISN